MRAAERAQRRAAGAVTSTESPHGDNGIEEAAKALYRRDRRFIQAIGTFPRWADLSAAGKQHYRDAAACAVNAWRKAVRS